MSRAGSGAGAGAGAALSGHGQELRDALCQLLARRAELSVRMAAGRAERRRLQERLAQLARRLAQSAEQLAQLGAARALIDSIIAQTEAASGQILDNSQTLLDILKEESGIDDKASEPQSSSLGQQARQQKRS